MGKDSYHEGCSSADHAQDVPHTEALHAAEVAPEQQAGERNAYQYAAPQTEQTAEQNVYRHQYAVPQTEQAAEQNAYQHQYAAPQMEQAVEQNAYQHQHAAPQMEQAAEQNPYRYQYAAPQMEVKPKAPAEMKPETPTADHGGQEPVRQGAPAGYPGPHPQGGKPEGVMTGKSADAHSCSCGDHPSPETPHGPMYGPQPGMPPFAPYGSQPGMPPFAPYGPQPGPFGAPMFGPQPAMPSFAPYGPQPGPFGAPVFGPQPGPFGAPMYGPQPGPHPGMSSHDAPAHDAHSDAHDHAAHGCSGKKGGGHHPQAFPDGQMPGYGPGSMDPKHLENRYGQLMAMCNDLMQGKADPMQVMSFLNSNGTNFWKGALVGAAVTFLLTNEGVKSALRETFSSLSSGTSQTE
jgi:hypothetical protein